MADSIYWQSTASLVPRTAHSTPEVLVSQWSGVLTPPIHEQNTAVAWMSAYQVALMLAKNTQQG